MKIGIIGYGKLGKAIELVALKRGHEIALRVTKDNAETYELAGCEMAIECSNPESSIGNIKKCLSSKVPVVIGSTGWYNKFEEVINEVHQAEGALLYATNFSIGVHLFWEANKFLAGIMNKIGAYDVRLDEIHHTAKKDAPSGTAITTAEIILKEFDRKKEWVLGEAGSNNDDQLIIKALREGDAKGTHIVCYESEVDRIELKHEAFSREGFAYGAVIAAEYLQNKKGVYSMRDVIDELRLQ